MNDPAFYVRVAQASDPFNITLLKLLVNEYLTWSDEQFEHCLTSDDYLVYFIYLEKEEKPIGCFIAQVGIDWLELQWIYVKPEYKVLKNIEGKNAAASLMEVLKGQCLALKKEKIILECRESNTRAVNFYNKHGFKAVGTRKNYYPTYNAFGAVSGKENAILMDWKNYKIYKSL